MSSPTFKIILRQQAIQKVYRTPTSNKPLLNQYVKKAVRWQKKAKPSTPNRIQASIQAYTDKNEHSSHSTKKGQAY